ncbi:hypothetical protein K5B43_004601 [Vibrio parahaemolyticus]|uniref:hypothetical protein n=1 Tax=Vibrio vulnificus TaxID=672 RepID=UPI000DAD56C0|nr:hypothetical protein [Vibrio vulnificus]EHY9861262.1 hypothetical protein [Vibrio parahaemolyticus]EJV9314229.1 hypothetical protein [Vibrio vulnificus]ELA3113746.1 hypothetical protein [Vibrio vulnificus]ELB7531537.1 hypothetical protein [Vibrio vulnificus]ELK2279601.1 hypothetical protein [Vibrio vulnificus]
MEKMTERQQLLLELEELIGDECYNGNIQNWGPNSTFLGEGRSFRYPITFIGEDEEKIKRKYIDRSLNKNVVQTGYYAFGANRLNIIRGLDQVLSYLESEYGLDLQKK